MNVSQVLVAVFAAVTVLGAGAADTGATPGAAPVRLAIVGLEHGHAAGFIPKARAHSGIHLVGIVEPNRELAAKYAARFKLPPELMVASLDDLRVRGPIEAVAAFTSTFDHLAVVESCAARGIHVMMEKPLAVSLAHAQAMQAPAAVRHGGDPDPAAGRVSKSR